MFFLLLALIIYLKQYLNNLNNIKYLSYIIINILIYILTLYLLSKY